jgi:hypothetical protein
LGGVVRDATAGLVPGGGFREAFLDLLERADRLAKLFAVAAALREFLSDMARGKRKRAEAV